MHSRDLKSRVLMTRAKRPHLSHKRSRLVCKKWVILRALQSRQALKLAGTRWNSARGTGARPYMGTDTKTRGPIMSTIESLTVSCFSGAASAHDLWTFLENHYGQLNNSLFYQSIISADQIFGATKLTQLLRGLNEKLTLTNLLWSPVGKAYSILLNVEQEKAKG
ncbi:hypothetical protein M569_00118 [Genlisea aurea]|uniref:Uncharacterized protein n=1 Tax=Genlisea aurea TaxID=192259 RepID=S8D4F3_9LAMI|nr:hypothetical protein M569_00118 [Genlisea aurea]